jgi:hypothetical protein
VKLTTIQIDKAVAWWSDALRAGEYDNGDASGAIVAAWRDATESTPTDEQIEAFKTALRETLEQADIPSGQTVVHVDYDPSPLLEQAVNASGLNPIWLPVKTRMWFDEDGESVSVRSGYGRPLQAL